MCSTDRPASYVVPGGYRPDEVELWRMQQEKEGIVQYQQVGGTPPPPPGAIGFVLLAAPLASVSYGSFATPRTASA